MRRLRWWWEITFALAGYAIYAVIRNLQGQSTSARAYHAALVNAERVISVERWTGLYHELGVQHLAMKIPGLIRALDSFWAVGYLVGTVAVIVWLLRWQPQRYRRLRTVLAVCTGLALVVFALFPALPPRLLPAGYGFIDTWARAGGIAAHHPPRLERISDPFAAMPSLHVAWAVWCTAAVAPVCRRTWTKVLAYAYPVATVVAVVATGNHFILDAVAGAGLVVLAFWLVGWAERLKLRRELRRIERMAPSDEERELALTA